MTDLLPCPKCGGLDMKLYITGGRAAFGCGEYDAEIECPCGIAFYTELCCETPDEAEAEAIVVWNTRVDVERGAVPMTEENMAEHGWVRERTCTVTGEDYDEWFDEVYTQFSCGHEVNGGKSRFNYCPVCGSKVVE